ncbi:MAG: tagaturonate epimerase family protein [Marinilabiliales bacterium]|nr:tagaturonate epimerase family protein [Marinilabiliales bacterium]
MKKIGKYSFGIGDRFAHQGVAQLRALMKAQAAGIEVTPVWNKSNREHMYVHSHPADTRKEADSAVAELGYRGDYCVDADHINLGNVQNFLATSDFFTIDVASKIGSASGETETTAFLSSCQAYLGALQIPGIAHPFEVDEALLTKIAGKFLAAIREAGLIYRHIVSEKGNDDFVTEISMDEVESPQSPVEMFFILKMIANEHIPAQTIAPKFTGRFNKGVDYVGDVAAFAREFEEDIHVIDFAIREFGLPVSLKLSVHSGSDKFSIYPEIQRILAQFDKGIHVKTAGTTWLEEVIGLALSGGDALAAAKSIYIQALSRQQELCAPYADVIDIDGTKLPDAEEVNSWSGEKFANTLRHIPGHPDYNPNLRQLIHVGYKIASEMGTHYTDLLKTNQKTVGACVEENLFERHLKRLFHI